MAKYPNKLVKFNTFNIIELISDATDIDISTIRQIDISLDTIVSIEISHIEIRSEDLDDYRYEIVSTRRDIDIYKYGVFNIYFNNREVDNNSNCNIKINNISINISARFPDDISINPIINIIKDNDENICVYERGYTKSEIYNYKRGACIANNSICIDVISIISKSEKEDDNINV